MTLTSFHQLFRTLPRHPEDEEWTLVHGFFADMGGFILESPDCEPFPVNAEQLHYLVSHGYVDFPRLRKLDIKVMSKTDGLSKSGTPQIQACTVCRGGGC
jgi:hypothetical protein